MDGVIEAGEEQQVLEEFDHILYSFQLGLGHSNSSVSHGGHGGGLAVSEVFVRHLDSDMVVIDNLSRLVPNVTRKNPKH